MSSLRSLWPIVTATEINLKCRCKEDKQNYSAQDENRVCFPRKLCERSRRYAHNKCSQYHFLCFIHFPVDCCFWSRSVVIFTKQISKKQSSLYRLQKLLSIAIKSFIITLKQRLDAASSKQRNLWKTHIEARSFRFSLFPYWLNAYVKIHFREWATNSDRHANKTVTK